MLSRMQWKLFDDSMFRSVERGLVVAFFAPVFEKIGKLGRILPDPD